MLQCCPAEHCCCTTTAAAVPASVTMARVQQLLMVCCQHCVSSRPCEQLPVDVCRGQLHSKQHTAHNTVLFDKDTSLQLQPTCPRSLLIHAVASISFHHTATSSIGAAIAGTQHWCLQSAAGGSCLIGWICCRLPPLNCPDNALLCSLTRACV